MHFMRYERSDFTRNSVGARDEDDDDDPADTRESRQEQCGILPSLRGLARMLGLIRGKDQGQYALLALQASKVD
jgi:hypothetical protein